MKEALLPFTSSHPHPLSFLTFSNHFSFYLFPFFTFFHFPSPQSTFHFLPPPGPITSSQQAQKEMR